MKPISLIIVAASFVVVASVKAESVSVEDQAIMVAKDLSWMEPADANHAVARFAAYLATLHPGEQGALTADEITSACAMIRQCATIELSRQYFRDLHVDSLRFQKAGGFVVQRVALMGLLSNAALDASQRNDHERASAIGQAAMLLGACDYGVGAGAVGGLVADRRLKLTKLTFDRDEKRQVQIISDAKSLASMASERLAKDSDTDISDIRALNTLIVRLNSGNAQQDALDDCLIRLERRWLFARESGSPIAVWKAANQAWRLRSAIALSTQKDWNRGLSSMIQSWDLKGASADCIRWHREILTTPVIGQSDIGVVIMDDPNNTVFKGEAPN